jgi:hypothetical protein
VAAPVQPLVDELLPEFDVSDTIAVRVRSDAARVWAALLEVDLIELGRRKPLIGVLGGARALPEIVSRLLHGERPPGAPRRLRLHDMPELPMDSGGWLLLGERRGEEIALGLVGRFWKPVIEYAEVDAAAFRGFAEPDWAKTVYALAVRPLEDGAVLLTGTMRTVGTDEASRRKFDRYWTFGVGSGAHILVRGLLEAVREDAEGAADRPPPR